MGDVYVLRDITSDLVGGAEFSRKLLTSTATSAVRLITIFPLTTGIGSGFTEPGVPGTSGAAGTYTVEVNITANTQPTIIQVSTQLHRVNSGGTIQNSSAVSAEQAGTVGIKTFTFSDPDLGTWVSGDRLRVDYRLRNTSATTAATVTLQFNTADVEVIITAPAPIYFFIPGFLWSGTRKQVPDFVPGVFWTERISTLNRESIPGIGGGGSTETGGTSDREAGGHIVTGKKGGGGGGGSFP